MSRIKLYKPFQHWQQSSNIYIISDTHFGDSNRELMSYSFTEKEQIKAINKELYGKKSTLIHLGDVGNPEYMNYIKAGQKILIKGNHDVGNSKYEEYFDEIYDGALFISSKILLSHEPICLPYFFNIHGHTHDAVSIWDLDENNNITGINLCPNISSSTPFSLNEFVNSGGIKNIQNIHRVTIEKAKISTSNREDINRR